MQRRILIVAASETIGAVLHAALADENDDVCVVRDRQTAAVPVQHWRPDVIIVNPGRSRPCEPRTLRRYRAAAPVIVCSVDQETVAAAARWPVDGVLSMPFDLTDLYALVESIAPRPSLGVVGRATAPARPRTGGAVGGLPAIA
jgi:DNA-binding response OmpR family regulator